jgi:hypothetical protein
LVDIAALEEDCSSDGLLVPHHLQFLKKGNNKSCH